MPSVNQECTAKLIHSQRTLINGNGIHIPVHAKIHLDQHAQCVYMCTGWFGLTKYSILLNKTKTPQLLCYYNVHQYTSLCTTIL